jgi:hypothetical protein
MGFLLDEEEYEVNPAITRQVTLFEFENKNKKRKSVIEPPRPNSFDLDLLFVSGNTELNEVFKYTADLNITSIDNVNNYSVYINNNYIGDDLSVIQITNGDTLKITVIKDDNTKQSIIKTNSILI